MTIENIPVGGYSITLRNDDFETAERRIEVELGVRVLEVALLSSGEGSLESEEVASHKDAATGATSGNRRIEILAPWPRRREQGSVIDRG